MIAKSSAITISTDVAPEHLTDTALTFLRSESGIKHGMQVRARISDVYTGTEIRTIAQELLQNEGITPTRNLITQRSQQIRQSEGFLRFDDKTGRVRFSSIDPSLGGLVQAGETSPIRNIHQRRATRQSQRLYGSKSQQIA